MSGGRKITWRVVGAASVVAVILLATGWEFKERSRPLAAFTAPHRVDIPPVAAASHHLSNVAPPHPPPAGGATGVDECGISKTPSTTSEGGEGDWARISAGEKTRAQWEAALLDSSDFHARAVGLTIHGFELLQTGSTVQAEESRDEVVQLAAGAGDPALYAVALGLCRKTSAIAGPADACQRITVSEWTRLDPDNVVPWLLAAQAARSKSDTQAESLAFTKAANAHKVDDYSGSLLSYGLTELPRGLLPAQKMALTIKLIGIEAAWGTPALSEINRYCSDAALKRDETRAECGDVAELLVSHSTDILTFTVGLRLGGRVGWPPEREKSLWQERDELYGLLPNESSGISCDFVNRMNAYIDKRAQLGELGALRDIRDGRASSSQQMIP
jgi:hypothetical protein